MYILISIGTNAVKHNELISAKKKTIEKYLKELGYYYSKLAKCYIDDRTVKIEGGSGIDYTIEKIKELK